MILGLSLPVGAAPKPIDYSPIDVGVRIRAMPATAEMIKKDSTSGPLVMSIGGVNPIDSKTFLILDDYNGAYRLSTFDLYAIGDGIKAQVWVQRNLAWPAGDPRTTPAITLSQISYILSQYENNILPKENSYFMAPPFQDGSNAALPGMLGLPDDYYKDASGRALILISNIRDANYYDSTYPIYIAGFYSPFFLLF